jgi:hypothetical protein
MLRGAIAAGWASILIPAALASGVSDYAGAGACRRCHEANFASQSATSHAHALARSAPPLPGDWAFGAGLQAITPVTRIGGDSYREDGLSWYRSINGYAITLGQHDDKGVVFRTLDPGARFLTCFGCHSTGPLSLGKDEEIVPHELGVRCEVCHGPGAAHAGDPARNRLATPAQLTAAGMNRFCGQCHRTDSETGEPLTDLRDARNARNQPLRLAASACFQRSAGRLNCVTCHAPHQQLEQNESSYDAHCQSCHKNKVHRTRIAGRACVSCHMPRVPNGPNVSFANHRIATYASGNPLLPAAVRVMR